MGFFRFISNAMRKPERDLYSDTSALITCESDDCPIHGPHKPGPYYHNGKPLDKEHETWGESNPPPFIWKALERYMKGSATPAEIHAVVTFQELHSHEWLME